MDKLLIDHFFLTTMLFVIFIILKIQEHKTILTFQLKNYEYL